MEYGINKNKRFSEEILILLTGCVDPSGMTLTKLQNPIERRQQYVKAIVYYLDKYDLPILFVENSGYDITPFLPTNIDLSRLEVLTFSGNDFDKSLGKGYGEMAIINEAATKSIFFDKSDFVIKITGRHKVLNFAAIVKQCMSSAEIDVVADLRDMGKYADSRCWGASKRFISSIFLNLWSEVNDAVGMNFEHVLAKAIHQAMGLNYQFEQLKNLARLSGSSGTENVRFNDSWLRWFPRDIVHQIKYFLNKR